MFLERRCHVVPLDLFWAWVVNRDANITYVLHSSVLGTRHGPLANGR